MYVMTYYTFVAHFIQSSLAQPQMMVVTEIDGEICELLCVLMS